MRGRHSRPWVNGWCHSLLSRAQNQKEKVNKFTKGTHEETATKSLCLEILCLCNFRNTGTVCNTLGHHSATGLQCSISSKTLPYGQGQPAAQKPIRDGACCCRIKPALPPMCTYANHLKRFKQSTNSFGCQPFVTGVHQYNRMLFPKLLP